jgi:heme/copper-type cytochrome/quinol oxidase subunit 2
MSVYDELIECEVRAALARLKRDREERQRQERAPVEGLWLAGAIVGVVLLVWAVVSYANFGRAPG